MKWLSIADNNAPQKLDKKQLGGTSCVANLFLDSTLLV